MNSTVQIIEVEGHPMAASLGHANAQNLVEQLFSLLDEVWKFLKANLQVKNDGLNVFVYYDDVDEDLLHTEYGMPIEAGVILTEAFEGAGKVVCASTPGGTVATAVHTGPYDTLGETHSAIRKWCKDNHQPIAGLNWEIYGHWTDDASQLSTQVFYLLK